MLTAYTLSGQNITRKQILQHENLFAAPGLDVGRAELRARSAMLFRRYSIDLPIPAGVEFELRRDP